jgi:hypothetical protein
MLVRSTGGPEMKPKIKHITAGRDGRGVETTLCGLIADWDEIEPEKNEWCQECLDADA